MVRFTASNDHICFAIHRNANAASINNRYIQRNGAVDDTAKSYRRLVGKDLGIVRLHFRCGRKHSFDGAVK